MLTPLRSHLALASLGLILLSDTALGFCPGASAPATAKLSLRRTTAAVSVQRGALVGLRCMAEDEDEAPPAKDENYIKLEKTQTSWAGWGSSSTTNNVKQIEVDSSNPSAAIQEALKVARESNDIAKYLGTSESKQKAGITGDVEFVSLDGKKVTLRLTGQFWHSRQMVFSDVCSFMKKALPSGTVEDIVIEDPSQLSGFAETSKSFESREKITEEDLRKLEAKGTNIYGEKLENPQAKFRRKKLEDQAKFEEEMERRRKLDALDEASQLEAILAETGAGGALGMSASGKKIPIADLRPEDILAQMLKGK